MKPITATLTPGAAGLIGANRQAAFFASLEEKLVRAFLALNVRDLIQ